MAQENHNVCSFNKFGFCKFRANCRRQHIKEICSNKGCEIEKCSQRHPRICRYHRDIGYCKFGKWCLFKHETLSSPKEMKVIAKKLETIEKDLEEKGIAIENLASSKTNNLEEVLKTVDDKIDNFENNLLTLKKCIAEKDTFISKLEKKVVDLETKLEDISKLYNEKIEELEKRVNVCDAKKNDIDNKVKDIEENQNNLIEESMEKYK